MEVNPDWVVEEEENGDQLQQQGPWLSPLIPVSKFSLKKRDPRGHGGAGPWRRVHGDGVQAEQEVNSGRHRDVPFRSLFKEGLAAQQ